MDQHAFEPASKLNPPQSGLLQGLAPTSLATAKVDLEFAVEAPIGFVAYEDGHFLCVLGSLVLRQE